MIQHFSKDGLNKEAGIKAQLQAPFSRLQVAFQNGATWRTSFLSLTL